MNKARPINSERHVPYALRSEYAIRSRDVPLLRGDTVALRESAALMNERLGRSGMASRNEREALAAT